MALPQHKRAPTALVIGGWMLIQTIAVVGTGSVRLWPHHPAPPQSVAMIELMVVQIVAVALFCPLIDGWDRALMMSAGVLFFDQIAAIQSAVPVAGAFRGAIAVAIWIAGGRLANGARNEGASIAPLALTLSALVPLLIRFGSAGSAEPSGDILSDMGQGIIERAIGQIDRSTFGVLLIATPGIVIFSSTILFKMARSRPRKSPHFTPPVRN